MKRNFIIEVFILIFDSKNLIETFIKRLIEARFNKKN